MRIQLIFCCIVLGVLPLLVTAQDESEKHGLLWDIIHTVQSFEDEFDDAEICAQSVVVYSRPNFRGDRMALQDNWTSGRGCNGWNNEIASVHVPWGWEVWLYERKGFRGRKLIVTRDWSVRDNPWWRDRISSVRIIPPCHHCTIPHAGNDYASCHAPRLNEGIMLFDKKRFSGATLTIYNDWSITDPDEFWNDRIRSMMVPFGYVVVLYEHRDFRGRSVTIDGSWSLNRQREFWSNRDFWKNRVSSIRVLHQT